MRGLRELPGVVVDLFLAGLDALADAVRWLHRGTWRAASRLDPGAPLLGVALAAAGVLTVSQFTDYRVVRAVTQDLGTSTAGSVHGYVLVGVAALALAAIWAIAFAKRPRAARALVALGLVGVAVTLAIDLRSGTEPGHYARLYEDVDVHLAKGFYAELAASAALTLAGLGLLFATGAGRRGPARRRVAE